MIKDRILDALGWLVGEIAYRLPWIIGALVVLWAVDLICGFCIYGPPLPDLSGEWGR